MARLNVEACSAEWTAGDVVYTLLVGVSVSRADDGAPVTGLKTENFRVASQLGNGEDFKVGAVYEWQWEPVDVEPAGCYQVKIIMTPTAKFSQGARYTFGLQARTFGKGRSPQIIDQGQTIFELISMGE